MADKDRIYEPEDFTVDERGNYNGPRGETKARGTDGKVYKGFVCHGCQGCWNMAADERVIDLGPHWLSKPVEVPE